MRKYLRHNPYDSSNHKQIHCHSKQESQQYNRHHNDQNRNNNSANPRINHFPHPLLKNVMYSYLNEEDS